jgi:hypothetical protein
MKSLPPTFTTAQTSIGALEASVTALTPSNMEPKTQAFAPRGAIYKSLYTYPRATSSEHEEQLATSKKSPVSATSKVNASGQIKAPVETQDQAHRTRGAAQETSVSVVIPAKIIPDAQQSTQQVKKTKRTDVTDNVAPDPIIESQSEVPTRRPKATPKIPEEPSAINRGTTAKHAEPSHGRTAAAITLPAFSPSAAPSPAITLSVPAFTSDAEPYFEYSIFKKIWSQSQDEPSADVTELTSIACTNIEDANAHAEKLFNDAREQYQQHFSFQFSEWMNKSDEHGCNVLIGTFAPIGIPSRKSSMKFWVQRDQVSIHAGRSAKDMKQTSFLEKTVYVLRLFQILPTNTESDSETEDTASTATLTRAYYPLPRTECYTTLDAANRAAKDLQIEMSHKPNPNAFDNFWQTKNLAELNQKVSDLHKAKNECAKHWKSEFDGNGPDLAKFELVVEKAGLCGPRNL